MGNTSSNTVEAKIFQSFGDSTTTGRLVLSDLKLDKFPSSNEVCVYFYFFSFSLLLFLLYLFISPFLPFSFFIGASPRSSHTRSRPQSPHLPPLLALWAFNLTRCYQHLPQPTYWTHTWIYTTSKLDENRLFS